MCPRSATSGSGSASEQGSLDIIAEITVGSIRAVEEVPDWGALEMVVDSGASATVIGEDMVKAVSAQNARPDEKYEVADGSRFPHLGENISAP